MAAVVNWQIPVFHAFPFFAPLHRNFLNHALSQCHIQYHHHAEAYHKNTVPTLECCPCDISGISSSTTTYSMAPAAKLSR